MSKSFWLLIAFSVSFIPSSFAKPYKAGFVRLNLPIGWNCEMEEQDYVCQPEGAAEKSEAIIVVVNKDKDNVDDTFDKYQSYLKKPREMRDLVGKKYLSKITYVRKRNIQGQTWIDSLHQGSEIPGFRTRYLATHKEKIAALVTYSIADSVYTKYSKVLDSVVGSMLISFDQNTYEKALNTKGSLLGNRKAPSRNKPVIDEKPIKTEEPAKKDNKKMLMVFILAALAGVYIVMKRKNG